MKTKILNFSKVVLASAALLFTACQPEEFELGELLTKDALNYSITQDSEDPNMIVLKSNNPGYAAFWATPMGRSTRNQDTIRIPFAGDYNFVYGIVTPGGVVQDDTFKLSITTNNLNYVNDPLWTLLSGGVGEEKTWLLDLNEDGVSKYFNSPLYFYGTDDSWETVTEGKEIEGDSWNWLPDWEGNQWIMPAGDYGSMTFGLKGNATITVDHKMLNRQESGTYFLDASGKTLRMTDASPLHDEGRDGQVVDWGDIRVMSVTENSMQLGVIRDEVLAGEPSAMLVYNYISKDYSDNWVPEDLPDPEPQLPEGWQDDVSQVVSTTITWKLSETTPLNWAHLDGSLMNEWNAPEEYPDWLGVHDLSVYEGFSLTMDSDDNSVVYVAPDGTEQEGTYTLDTETGIYTFSDINPSFPVIGWGAFGLTAENQLRILSIQKNEVGRLTGMWVGALSPDKPEYMAYLLVPSMGGSSEPDPAQAVVNMLTSKTWKLDSERTYDVATSWGAEQGPVIFSDYSSWSYNPLPGEQYGAGEPDVDYGTMTFNKDGSVVVNQRVRRYSYTEEGETLERSGLPVEGDVLDSDEVEVLNGTWSFDYETKEVSMSVGMLHPWTADYAVADWGDTKIYKIQNDALLLQVMRSQELSGEDAMPLTYVFVPVVE
ncbi:hypothetical protein [Geofilum rubicundum]|uniref:Uncharacterized protein n=1 Tax=Geofilum rubicundum JCM 15548 TaxID=1236989 RepID=A0A0E9LWV3_9BACT|nr:hypothetical protein [Geofilum rubicundum]GAO29788.1 hypothetical protein JCM15548_12015 [Geofilum rubicundum JCM 15548]